MLLSCVNFNMFCISATMKFGKCPAIPCIALIFADSFYIQQAIIKPQYVDHIPKAVQGNVGQVLDQKRSERIGVDLF